MDLEEESMPKKIPCIPYCWKSGNSEFLILVQCCDAISIRINSTVALYGVQSIFNAGGVERDESKQVVCRQEMEVST